MVTMYTQNYSQFDIHARVLLGLPLPDVKLNRTGASHVILADKDATGDYLIEGIEKALEDKSIDFRIFGKPILIRGNVLIIAAEETLNAVSYTHLTLPTKA